MTPDMLHLGALCEIHCIFPRLYVNTFSFIRLRKLEAVTKAKSSLEQAKIDLEAKIRRLEYVLHYVRLCLRYVLYSGQSIFVLYII